MMAKGGPRDPRPAMRRQLLYALFALLALVTAGPLLALALAEATRLLGDSPGELLFAGIVISTTILLLVLVIVQSLRTHHRRRPLPRQVFLADLELVDSPSAPCREHHPLEFSATTPIEVQRFKPNTLGFAIKCVAFGATFAAILCLLLSMFSETGVSPFALMFCALYGATLGFGVFIMSLIPPTRPRKRLEPRPPRPEHRPKEFAERLAGYLHCEQEELAAPRPYAPSKMSFWSRVGQLRWFGPKPAWLMRRLLERIREQVHGRAH